MAARRVDPRWVVRWWPLLFAPAGLFFTVWLPEPHAFTHTGYLERSAFFLSFGALMWLAFRPYDWSRVLVIVTMGLAALSRAAAYIFQGHGAGRLSVTERAYGAMTWTMAFVSVALLTILTQTATRSGKKAR